MGATVNTLDPVFLAIETSHREGSVALRVRGGDTNGLSFSCGTRQEDHLLPSIDALFEKAGLEPDSLDAIGVSIGPGGFTGLRIGVSTAKGIAEVTGCSLLAVPSAHVAAEACRERLEPGDRIVVVSAAKSSSCWVTPLVMEVDCWRENARASVHVLDPPTPEVIALCQGALVLADEYVPSAFKGAVECLETPVIVAEACLHVAMGMLQRGETTDSLLMKPLYPANPKP